MNGSECVFDYVHLLYYKCHKINPNRDGSYIASPDSIKNKKATINLINKKDNECFQYAITFEIQTFMNKYKWEGINFLSENLIR